jgi:hypothetical protein
LSQYLKIGHTISRSLFPKIIISVLILGYLRIEVSKTGLNEASANVLLQASFILIIFL